MSPQLSLEADLPRDSDSDVLHARDVVYSDILSILSSCHFWCGVPRAS